MGRLVTPFYGFYSGSKWALEAMAEGYRYELKATGVEVSIVQPGAFKTQLGASAVVAPIPSERVATVSWREPTPNSRPPSPKRWPVPALRTPKRSHGQFSHWWSRPPGTRPLRVVVDASGGEGAAALNKAAAEIQRELLSAMGMSSLAD